MAERHSVRRPGPAQPPDPTCDAVAGDPGITPDPGAARTTEQLLVQVLVRSVRDALRALAEGRVGEDAEDVDSPGLRELTSAFVAVWGRLPHVVLDVGSLGVAWEGTLVLGRTEDDVDLAHTLSASGIQRISFGPGVETAEMPRFLRLVDEKRRTDPDGDLDLVTRLFREDFQHLRYTTARTPDTEPTTATASTAPTLVGDPSPPSAPLPPVSIPTGAVPETPLPETAPLGSQDARTVRETVRREADGTERTRGIVQLDEFDSTLYFLDPNEIEYLRRAIDQEYGQDHAQNVLAMLLDVLELQSDASVRGEVVGVLTTLMPYLLGTGRFESVAYLTGEIRALTRSLDLEAEHRQALDALRTGVSETRAVAQLFHALEAGEIDSTPDNLGILLRQLSSKALQTILVWVGQLTSTRARGALVESLEAFFAEWPSRLSRMFEASDRTVVHRALGLAAKLRPPELVDALSQQLDSDEPTTRRLAARALASIGTAAALRGVVKVIRDPDPDVRRFAYETLATRPIRGALKALTHAIESHDLESRDLSERRALFEAYGAVAGAGGVTTLEPILLGKGLFGRRTPAETRACAAVGLGVIGTPAARFALEKAVKDRDPMVRSAAGAALRAEG